ncbi:helix-turn-helix transcriptional regulator [Lipingzhangella sp. LS1_29]|uniref:Helix-turn-helix transcriptional regulator n=1 Tax=Lipingzhangella rawalii TaxID=2055835 RepID=A0ABU2H7E9_9ACTN|nr:helix-turn-helix transcriptional regulator [Lipingzhangella rawalii]MDS1270725.1 helix-turn-helix transcriptional regulator [Lipingzhangella rawalii]
MSSPWSSAQQALQSLGVRLREIRTDAGLSGLVLAERAGWHSSKVSKIEHARQRPTPEDVRRWCEVCDAVEEVADLVQTLRSVEEMFVSWRRLECSGFDAINRSVQPLWERTRRFRIYQSQLVPGPLQTSSYIATVLFGVRNLRTVPDDVAATVQTRLDRQRVVREGDHRFAVVLEESVLRHPVGGTEAMAGQLGHLLEAASLPSVALGVIPLGADRSAMLPVEGFWMFDDVQLDVELVSGFLRITQPGEIAMYGRTFSLLAEQAVYGAQARALINAAIEALT